jgi:hypothetical protein
VGTSPGIGGARRLSRSSGFPHLVFRKTTWPQAWIDVHGDYQTVSAGKPRIRLPIGFDPLHDCPIDSAITGSVADAYGVDPAEGNGEVQIDPERLKVSVLLFPEHFPLYGRELRHVSLATSTVAVEVLSARNQTR